FTLYGSGRGEAHWHTAGAALPAYLEETDLVVTQRFPMAATGEPNLLAGRFPLRGDGLYRVELRNELGHANKPMKEAKFAATPDEPPQIAIQKPGADITLSTPGKLPLVIEAYDDYGLLDVWLWTATGGGDGFRLKRLKKYDVPTRTDALVHTLDLAA